MNTIDEFFEIYKKHVDYVSELEQNYIQQGIQFGKEQYKMWYSATTFLSYAIKMLMMNAGTIQIPPEYTIELEKLVSTNHRIRIDQEIDEDTGIMTLTLVIEKIETNQDTENEN